MLFVRRHGLFLTALGFLSIMLAGCGRNVDLAKIVGKNISYEIRHPIASPSSKLEIFPRDNPGIHFGWIGHSTVLISFYGTRILIDPNFSKRIVLARRVVGLPIEPEEIKELDLILISHAHYDHLDRDSLKRLPKDALLIIPKGCRDLVENLGFSKIMEMNGDDVLESHGLQIEALKPAHWGRRSPWDETDRGYNSYIISKNGQSILFAGDTGHSGVFAEKGVGRGLSLAFFPITAYKPDWFQRNHATPEQALRMFTESGAQFMIPIHWGTFILSHEPLDEPIARLKAEALRLKIEDRVVILRHGESFSVPE
jgi:L-ascorbate metabolism protein UlaG (beta-lactamase superfamily)